MQFHLSINRTLRNAGLRARREPVTAETRRAGRPVLRKFVATPKRGMSPLHLLARCLSRPEGGTPYRPQRWKIPATRFLSLLVAVGGCLTLQAADGSGLVNGHPSDIRTLKIGDAAPEFELIGIDGKLHKLEEYNGGEVLVVLFTSNHCPTSHGMEPRLKRFYDEYTPKGVKLVAINPNHPDGLSNDELGYGEFGDSYEEMKLYAGKNKWPFDYLYDGEKQSVARAYGCLATPHAFVFDRNLNLRYAGRFDDSRFHDESTVKSRDVQTAVDAILAGQPVPVEITRPHGCSTKWREKKVLADAIHERWAKTPVSVETIDDAGLAKLRANSSNKYRLFNVWATWCAPCVQEFPDLVAISRRFDMRDFELVTISLDQPSDVAKAEAFLFNQAAGMSSRVANSVRREGRTSNHYLFTGSADDLTAALDKEMPGPIPHTIVVAPGGEIVYRHNGVIDRAETLNAILDRMSRYYSSPPGAAR